MKFLVVSDIHANPEALSAVLGDALQEDCRGFLCLGDITGYGPDPDACVRLVLAQARDAEMAFVLSGNHDAALTGKIPVEWFNAHAQRSVQYTRSVISEASVEWLDSLEHTARLDNATWASHGSPLEPLTGYLWGGLETAIVFSWMTDSEFSLCFCGHTHEAALYYGKARKKVIAPAPGDAAVFSDVPAIVNPGSVGFPRTFNGAKAAVRKGRVPPVSRASYPAYYAIWDQTERTVSWREVRYDRRPLEERLSRAGL
ncbi:MAG: Calcineurin-like phosphoesterase superfamily domain protein [Spirochaetes bacterium ADurb.Bin269]|jgi:predicted phosphodiesterase|nr:MAG: Calcineurin-like phosphoesterase superfamily domain protein [Spirochaetes bacterium ADurb.Bin269]